MKQFLAFLCFFCIVISGQGQELPILIPPSPESSSLVKYVDTPVSLYNGLPIIDIPFYTISLDNLSLPIYLSYHAQGVPVAEIASRVGLGWTLKAGGLITRQIKGGPDEYVINSKRGYLIDDFYSTFYTDENTRKRIYDSVVLNEQDLIPDSFMFNFLGYSGKFYFDQRTNLPVIQGFSDLSIIPIWANNSVGPIAGWKIITPDGYIAHFGTSPNTNQIAVDNETIIMQAVYQEGLLINSGETSVHNSWHLLDVTSPKGRSVNFNYFPEESTYIRKSFDQYKNNIYSGYFSQVRSKQYQLQSITFDEGKVEFISSLTEREDLNGSYALDKIKIFDYNNDHFKTYKFIYVYTSNTSKNNILPTSLLRDDPTAEKRLFLDLITQKNDDETKSLPPYRFHYSSEILPNRFSNAQDLWGYYNGKNNGFFLTFLNNSANSPDDRSVDSLKVQAGILKKINYPTGGSINFEYESNRALAPVYFKEHLVFYNTDPLVTKSSSIAKRDTYYKGTYYETEKFTINKARGYPFISSTVSITPNELCNETNPTTTCPYRVQLYSDNFSAFLNTGQSNVNIPDGSYRLKVYPRHPGSENPDDAFQEGSTNFSVALQWKERSPDQLDEDGIVLPRSTYTSGCRIKRIKLCDENDVVTTKEYEYKDSSGRSSGKVFALPEYYHTESQNSNFLKIDRLFGARPGGPLTFEQGNHEGYSFVTEYEIGSGGEKKKTTYQFTTFEDSGSFYKFPYHPATDNEWLRGKLLEKKYFLTYDNSYELIRSQTNKYLYSNETSPLFLMNPLPTSSTSNGVYVKNRIKQIQSQIIFADQDGTIDDSDEYNEFKTYYFSAGSLDLISTTNTDFLGTTMLSHSKTFNYNYDKHYQPSQTVTTNSDGKTTTIKMYYPEEVIYSTSLGYDPLTIRELSALQALQKPKANNPDGRHRVTEPVQLETVVKSSSEKALARKVQRTLFSQNATMNQVLPISIQTTSGTTPLEDRIIYSRYDEKGNPTEVRKNKGVKIVYLWGYYKTKVIAKIEGMSYTDISELTITDLQTKSNLDSDNCSNTNCKEQIFREALKELRETFPKSMVTTFTYDPLVGVTSRTDPNGFTLFYEYDDFKRLKFVRDDEGNIVTENEYGYKN